MRISDERWREIDPYIDMALDLSGAERASWLRAMSEKDASLAADLETLLRMHDTLAGDGFLERSPAPPPLLSEPGEPFGAYTLLRPLGRGGMGSVWLAERSDGRFGRYVAVKVLASIMRSAGEERFRREGSILARLKHPHIADLLDAGVS